MLSSDILYTALYIGLMGGLLMHHQRLNEGRWGIGSYTLLSYFIYPIVGIFWFFNPMHLYGQTVALQLFPFLYLAAMEWIALRPVLQYDYNHIQRITPPTMVFLNTFAFICVVCTLLQIPRIVSNLADGLRMIVLESAGSDLYRDSQILETSYDGTISNLPAVIFNIFSPLSFILFFYYLTLEKRQRWAEIGFALCILIKTFLSLSKGQRTEVTMSVFNLMVSYLALRPMLSARIRRNVQILLMLLAAAILIPFAAISISRFGERDGGLVGGLVYYIGEAPYYFNNYALDAGGIRYGDRTAPIFKSMLGMHTPGGIFDVRDAYSYMKMNDSVFSTFIGDFVLDYGPWMTVVIFIFFSFLCSRLTRPDEPHQLPFHRLILIYFAMSVCMQGGMYLFNYSFEGNLQIIAIMLFYGFFCLDYLLRKKRKEVIA